MGRLRHEGKSNRYQIQTIQFNHREILRLRALGMTNKEIAARLGLSQQSISIVANSDLGNTKLKQLSDARDVEVMEVRKQIRELAPLAIETLRAAMEGEDVPHHVRVAAAKDSLDRGGFAAPKQVQVTHGHFTPEDIEGMLNRAVEAGAIVDVELEQSEPEVEAEISEEQAQELLDDMLKVTPPEVDLPKLGGNGSPLGEAFSPEDFGPLGQAVELEN